MPLRREGLFGVRENERTSEDNEIRRFWKK